MPPPVFLLIRFPLSSDTAPPHELPYFPVKEAAETATIPVFLLPSHRFPRSTREDKARKPVQNTGHGGSCRNSRPQRAAPRPYIPIGKRLLPFRQTYLRFHPKAQAGAGHRQMKCLLPAENPPAFPVEKRPQNNRKAPVCRQETRQENR